MRQNLILFFAASALIMAMGCDKSTPVAALEHSLFETIEHAAIHMVGGPIHRLSASSVLPGTHIEPDSMEHQRLDIALLATETLKGGYVHFGPAVSGDLLVMSNAAARIRFINRTVVGDSIVDTPLETEQHFSAQQIADSAAVRSIAHAWLFEAQAGANILCIDSVNVDTLRIVIEEIEHAHTH